MGHVCIHLVENSSNIYLILTKNTQFPIYWFASKYASFMLLAQVIWNSFFFIMPRSYFDNTLNFDITFTSNGRDCVEISLDINFYASVAFRLHFSMSN